MCELSHVERIVALSLGLWKITTTLAAGTALGTVLSAYWGGENQPLHVESSLSTHFLEVFQKT